MSSSSRELVFLILQFLDEERFKETVHKLEKESGFFFNMRYFEDAVTNGEWEDLEKYLSGFTKVDDNRYSMKIFYELRKQKYLEALDKGDHAKAVEILTKDLKVFSTFNEDLYKEMILLLVSSNFRENEQFSKYGDANSARAIMLVKLKKLIEANPVFRDKLQFPTMVKSTLRTLVNLSLNRQQQPNSAHVPSHVPPMGGPSPFQHGGVPLTNSLAGWMAAPPSLPHQAIPVGPMGLTPPNIPASIEKRTRSPPTNNPALDYQTADSEHMFKRSRSFRVAEEGHNVLVNILPIWYPGAGQSQAHSMYSVDDLPKNVVANFNQGSAVKSMDFHPVQQTLLLVGTNIGDISLWDVSSGKRLRSGKFEVWNIGNCSMTLQASFANEYTALVNRVRWSPDGRFFGVAYSKHIFHFHEFSLNDVFIKALYQIDAHIGSVNDLAFSNPNKQLCIITCGEDKTVKVWDAATGAIQYIFKGHEASVYSVCPHSKENIQFIYSTAVDGKIKAWLYDDMGSRVDYDAPGHSCTTMAYSADGTRLFCGGTNKEGESHIVEWNERAGAVKRAYLGLGKCSVGVVQFDTTRNRLLAAGDEFTVKYWDMDNVNLLSRVDADGGLLASPCVRFNKEGMLLAVSTSENGVKILANAEGVRLVRSIENRAGTTSKASIMSTLAGSGQAVGLVVSLNGESRNLQGLKPRVSDELEKSKIIEISQQSQLRSLRLPDRPLPKRIFRLTYNNSGGAIGAIAYDAVLKHWKWQRKATTSVPPQHSQPPSRPLMTNSANPVPCFPLCHNDSYAIAASGGKILFLDRMYSKIKTTRMPSPPEETVFVFHPQDNNVIALGMEDSSIQIYNICIDEVTSILKGHQKRVTGLAFSNVLVSSGADAQIIVWSFDAWEKQASKFLQIPLRRASNVLVQTKVKLHRDHKHVMVVHGTQIAVYEISKLDCIKQWLVPRESNAAITDATYSCDSQSIYACFDDGTVNVFTSGLMLRCRINPSAYLPPNPSGPRVYPLVITANPAEASQFALGLTDGGVHMLEPIETEGKWGTVLPVVE